MDLIISSKYTTHLDLVVLYLCDHVNDAAFVFANSRALTFRVVTSLEEKIDKADSMAIDVLHVHGALEKDEKHAFTNLFTGDLSIEGHDHRIMVATSAADLGIDHTECTFVLILEWPDSLASYVQRRGRAGRRKQISKIIIVAGLASVISLVKRIHRQQDKPSDVIDESEQNNVVICNTHVATPKKAFKGGDGRRKGVQTICSGSTGACKKSARGCSGSVEYFQLKQRLPTSTSRAVSCAWCPA